MLAPVIMKMEAAANHLSDYTFLHLRRSQMKFPENQQVYKIQRENSSKQEVQDRQCIYNVTLRSVHESLLLWKSSISVCVCAHACILA